MCQPRCVQQTTDKVRAEMTLHREVRRQRCTGAARGGHISGASLGIMACNRQKAAGVCGLTHDAHTNWRGCIDFAQIICNAPQVGNAQK